MAFLSRMWSWCGSNEKQIKLVFALVGAAYVVFQYHAHKLDVRVDRVVSLARAQHEGQVLEATNSLRDFYTGSRYREWIGTVTPDRYHDEIARMLAESELTGEVYVLLGFLGSVATCVESELCDEQTACDVFFEEIQSFRENHRGLLGTWKSELGDKSIDDLAEFAIVECAAEFAAYCKEVPSPDCPG